MTLETIQKFLTWYFSFCVLYAGLIVGWLLYNIIKIIKDVDNQ